MTPPAPAPARAAVPTTAVPAPRLRAVPTRPAAVWACDNCELPNAARRKRCTDCGTSRD